VSFNDTYKFLNFLYEADRPITFAFGLDNIHANNKYGPYPKTFNNNNKSIKEFTEHAIYAQDYDTRGVFLTVNEIKGKRSDNNVVRINALYAELDYSADNRDSIIQKLKDLEIPPNMIVASKNGPHAYWVVSDMQVSDFDQYQHGLYAYLISKGFNPDSKSINKSRLLRVPGFYHLKDINDPFMLDVVHFVDKKYSTGDLKSFLGYEYKKVCIKNKQTGRIKDKVITTKLAITNNYYNNYINKLYNINNINININKDNKYISLIRNNKLYFKYEDFIKFINTIDLKEVFEFNKSTQCFFHNDSKPSASYYQSASGDWLYTCHSDKCEGKALNNIHFIAKLCHITAKDVVKILKAKLKVITSVEHINNAQKRIEFNLKALQSIKGSSDYPNTNKLLKLFWNDLESVVQYQSDRACSDQFIYRDKPLVFLSNRYLGKINNRDKNSANRLFNMFAVVGLIVKVREEGLSEHVLHNAKMLQANMTARAGKTMNMISFYAMPVYTDELLAQVEAMCGKLLSKGITVSCINCKVIEQAVNIETAMRAYKIIRVIKPVEIKEQWIDNDDDIEEFLEEIHWIDPLEEYVASLFNRGSPMEVYEMSCLKNERML